MSEWIKCSDQIPPENKQVLVWCGSISDDHLGCMIADWSDFRGKPMWLCPCRQTDPIKPSHWMYLPGSPTENGINIHG